MMKSFVIFLTLGLVAVLCKPRHRDIGFLEHVGRVNNFPCRVPQLRAIPVEELLTVGPSADEIFFPRYTVLGRCDRHSGCCQQLGQVCAPVEIANVSLVFTVKHMVDQRERHHEVIHAVNHTRCSCVGEENAAVSASEQENFL